MRFRRRAVTIVLPAVLVLVFALLFDRTTAVDFGIQNRVMLELRELEKLNAEWNVNILRARIGLDSGYQALAAPLTRIHLLRDSIHEALALTEGPAAPQAYQQFSDALQKKERLVEQFKLGNAVLRAALAELPRSVTELKTELNGIEGALVPARTLLSLDGALNALLADILRFNLAPDVVLARRIEHTLGTMLVQKAAFSPTLGGHIDLLLRDARTVLRYRPLENVIEGEIGTVGAVASIEQLVLVFDKAFDDVLVQKQRYRSWLFAYCALLLLLLLYGARRLTRTYRLLGVANLRLQAANQTLELRVSERTAELEAQSAKLEKLAQHDALTGLINYAFLTSLLEHALVRASRRESTVVLMFVDLDGFKVVNDTFGHATGDLVLKAVAQRVQNKLRQEDSLARLGGDEFVILLEEVKSRDGAMRVAQLALDQINGIVEAGGHPISISASIGISSAHGRAGAARGAAALLAEADQAMYQAKQAGKAGCRFSAQAQWPPPAAAATTTAR